MDQLKNILNNNIMFILIGVVVLIIGITLFMRHLKLKKTKLLFDEIESKYSILKNIPLSFKYNKAIALSRVNHSVSEALDTKREEFDITQNQLKECNVLLTEIEDYIFDKKMKNANELIEKFNEEFEKCDVLVKDYDKFLDHLLEQESEQREQVNILKEQFRNLKFKINNELHLYSQCNEYVEKQIVNIENMFSTFEEWMYANEFDKAASKQDEIKLAIESLANLSTSLPSQYEKVKGILPKSLESLTTMYLDYKTNGIYLEHLKVQDIIEEVSNNITNLLNSVTNGEIEGLEKSIVVVEEKILNTKNSMNDERHACEYVNDNFKVLINNINEVNDTINDDKTTYNEIWKKFGLKDLSNQFNELDVDLDNLNSAKLKVNNNFNELTYAASKLVGDIKELDTLYDEVNAKANEVHNLIITATADEERAKKQSVKLQLLLNEINGRIKRSRLPVINEQYETDIQQASYYIRVINEKLQQEPIETVSLNIVLKEAVDFIYLLFNNVNDLVGVAEMVENAIVFGNRYRSSYPEIDSELTRSEVCYRHGQYTKAIKIAINAIDKLHPGAIDKLTN